jgi:hypothetical protein
MMKGGSITGNIASNQGRDVALYWYYNNANVSLGSLVLSGNPTIGNISVYGNSVDKHRITIGNNNFTGSVGTVDLAGGVSNWVNGQVIKTESGTLTKAMVEKFDLVLGDFVDGTTRTPITGLSSLRHQNRQNRPREDGNVGSGLNN